MQRNPKSESIEDTGINMLVIFDNWCLGKIKKKNKNKLESGMMG